MIRHFLLVNGDGNTYDLNNENSFLQNPDELGMEVDTEYEQVGYVFVETTEKIKQKTPKGEIVFAGYEEYYEFARFIDKKPLCLKYTIPVGTFCMDVKVKKISKSEIEDAGLVCEIEFEAYGTFYKEVTVRNVNEYAGKVYSYTYPYEYSDFQSGVVEIETDSVYESPAKITIWGPCKNPGWAHLVNGENVCKGKLNLEIPDGNKLIVDTTQVPWSIREYDANNNFVADRYEYSDFSTERFVLLRKGKNKLVFSNEGIKALKIAVEAKLLYGAV